jgi:RHS repeat-associated protein
VTVTRNFTLDEAGTIVKVTISTTGGSTTHDGTYLVTYNGHGDALTLEKIESNGSLTVANRFAYSTWGAPTVTTHNGHPDHRFRYRYVGRHGVADDTTTLIATGLHYMHARHYSPELGRFLTPDPAALETNLYAYAGNSPVTKVDPSGEWWCFIPFIGQLSCAAAARILIFGVAKAPRLISLANAAGYVGLRVGPYVLKTDRLAHILSRHSSAISNATLRAQDVLRLQNGLEPMTKFLSDSRITSLIDQTLSSGFIGRVMYGAMEYARRFPLPVGVDAAGKAQYWVRVLVVNGQVISAYPAARAFRP